MAQAKANGITIDYEVRGSSDGLPLVMIRGLGTQRIQWPEPMVGGLVERGLRVICFDNRDVGKSTKLDEAGDVDLAELLASGVQGAPIVPPYTLDDMALDVVGLLDALEIRRAHVLGISMGGMIAQLVAARHRERVGSLISMMSSSGDPTLPPSTPEAMEALLSEPEIPGDRESFVRNYVETAPVLGSPGYPEPEPTLRGRAERIFDRCYYPEGVRRQMLAVTMSLGRHELLKEISAPTLVIHGEDDPLVRVEGGIDTARRIPGAVLETIPGMGHNLPEALAPRLVALIAEHVLEADRRA